MAVYYFQYVPGILIALIEVNGYGNLLSSVDDGNITTNRRFSQYLVRVR